MTFSKYIIHYLDLCTDLQPAQDVSDPAHYCVFWYHSISLGEVDLGFQESVTRREGSAETKSDKYRIYRVSEPFRNPAMAAMTGLVIAASFDSAAVEFANVEYSYLINAVIISGGRR